MAHCPACGEHNPDRFRLCGSCGAHLVPSAPAVEVRKTVTIVFSDLKGSTSLGEALDSESLREVMTRYFQEMSGVLTYHGGSVEKYIGDAVMAVFGLPHVHEDDALRAVRAADQMTEALEVLNDELDRTWCVRLTNRTGVNTGEVVAGTMTGNQRLVTGDAVNVAARLEQAAPPNGVLIGESTYRLVRDAVEVEPLEPLELKGKSDRMPAFRLLGVRAGEGFARRLDAPLVGREQEMTRLQLSFERALDERTPRLVLVAGAAGVGKSRLTGEFLDRVRDDAAILQGRCLPYGEGITFWPLAEVVRQAAGIEEDDAPLEAMGKLSAVLDGERDAALRVAAAIGLSESTFPLEEVFWAARKLVEALARRRPLVIRFDDVHWAEPTFLDLIEHLVEAAQDAPTLLVCTARQELFEGRPEWGEDRSRFEVVRLEPLSEDESALIVENLLGTAGVPVEVLGRISRSAEGNPLFVEQMLSMLIDQGALRRAGAGWQIGDADIGDLDVPPTITALLESRLDRLPADERAVLERGAVCGLVFYVGAVAALSAENDRSRIGPLLLSLRRKQFIRPDESSFAGEEAHRFLHGLIRDAAYRGLLKRARIDLHLRFADWLEEASGARVLEYEEIVGYHLEQAFRYRSALGPVDDGSRAVGRRGAERLAAAGRRAFARGDMPAAANLLERAAALLTPNDTWRLRLLPDLAEALSDVGEFERADGLLQEVLDGAAALGDGVLATEARLVRLFLRYTIDPRGWAEQAEDEAMLAIPRLQAAGHHAALVKAYRLLGWIHGTACQYRLAEEAVQHAVRHARLAGDRRAETRNLMSLALSALYGPMPLAEAIERSEEIAAEVKDDQRSEGVVLCALAHLYAMEGSFERARALYRTARTILEDLGGKVLAATTSLDSARVELLAQRPDLAELELRPDFQALQAIGEKYALSTTAALLAMAVFLQDRTDEAEDLSFISEDAAAEDDIESQMLWRRIRARVLARRGDLAEAERLVRDAMALIEGTDSPVFVANTVMDLGDVLRLAGRSEEAAGEVRRAITLYQRKGDLVSEARARSVLAELTSVPMVDRA